MMVATTHFGSLAKHMFLLKFKRMFSIKERPKGNKSPKYSLQLYVMYLEVELNLANPLMTLLMAARKSFSIATLRRARMANMPASVQTERISAPVQLGQRRAKSS